MYRFPSATHEQLKHRSANCRQSWEHSARSVKPGKPSKEHATASVDDMPARTENRPQEPRHPATKKIIKFFQEPPWMVQNMYPSSNQALRQTPVVAPTGTTTLSRNWTNPKLQLRKLHSFCTTQLGHLSLHNNRRVDNHPKNCNCEISTVCCTVCTVRTKICMRLESPPLCRCVITVTWPTRTPSTITPDHHRLPYPCQPKPQAVEDDARVSDEAVKPVDIRGEPLPHMFGHASHVHNLVREQAPPQTTRPHWLPAWMSWGAEAVPTPGAK